jgi:thiol:disulfide interchange protein DsbD
MEGRLSRWDRTVRRTLWSLGAGGILAFGAPHAAGAQPGRISIEVATVAETDVAHANTTHRVALDARLQPAGSGLHVNSNEPLEDFLIPTVLTVEPPAGIALEGLAWPEPVMLEQQGAEQPLAVFEEAFAIGVALAIDPDLAPGDYEVPASLRYQACDERMCYIPATARLSFQVRVAPGDQARTVTRAELFERMAFTAAGAADPPGAASPPAPAKPVDEGDVLARLERFTVAATTGGYLNEEQFIEFIRRAESGEAEQGWFEGRGPMAILALILIGGLALNLTPCVLPMIPINLAIIGAGARAGSRLRGFSLGSAYGLAMALVYGVLGLVVILTAGTFGTINASPWFNLGIALLFVVLTLAMFDIITIDFSRFQGRFASGPSGRGSFLLAFGMGGVAALLAGACVAPVVIQVIVFSSNLYGTGTTLALALPFVLGIGMAIPWPVAGAGLTFMPKPGPWMVRVKQAFGVFILGTAVYYGYLSYGLFSQRWVDPDLVAESVQELVSEGWYPSLAQGLASAETEGKPVLVDIWATWCKNCLTMDRTTLKAAGVQAALDDYVKVKFQAEDLGVSPAREVMERFEAIGLPAYAILHVRDGAGVSAD